MGVVRRQNHNKNSKGENVWLEGTKEEKKESVEVSISEIKRLMNSHAGEVKTDFTFIIWI